MHLLVEREQVFDPLALGCEARPAVEPIYRAIDGPVGFSKLPRHEVGVVEFGECRVRVSRSGVEHRLRQGLQGRQIRILRRHGEGVVDDTN